MPTREDHGRERRERAPRPAKKTPVVGIGASAGGVEALQQFFAAVPDDLGLAYVVIVHLAPDRDSELPAILARRTKMPVKQVGDHKTTKLLPNCVYVIAPNRKLEITDTSVGASGFEQPRGQRTAIDLFFRSLASRHGDGVAVVLSGSGTDGALGARAVKEAGGVVLVQDPDEAGHDGMPRAVVAAGIADVVLPVRELADRLAAFVRNKERVAPLLRAAEEDPPAAAEDNQALQGIFTILRKRTGHDFSKYKRGTVLRRLARRLQLSHRASVAEYLDYLRDNAEEVQALFDDFLITVTTFFRDPGAWQALQEQVIAPLVEGADADEPIRAWVPGCATGEEAYTLAILLREEIERQKADCSFTIFASDVDERALATAREGVYPAAIAADVTDARLERYFRLQDHHYRVTAAIRERVVFAAHSLLRDPPFSRLHLVSCRNLLIYLGRELQEQVIGLFRYACREGGYLFLGISESADDQAFRTVDKKHRIFQVRKSDDDLPAALPPLLAAPRADFRSRPASPPRVTAAEIHLQALEAVAPPSLLVDDEWTVLHLSNTAARYLQQRGGPFARHVTAVVREELRDELHMILHRVFEGAGQQLSAFVPVRFNGTARRVAVMAQRHRPAAGGRPHALVTFLEAGEAAEEEAPGNGGPSDDIVRALREKLRQAQLRADGMRDDQHLANEDLRAANEELQSLNEEYRSTTEELETSKEELQSVNEELQTVNQELKTKVEEISRAHADLENLMAATEIPTLFLDRELRINRFTPPLAQLFNVTSRDRGRPISDFTHSLHYPDLQPDARSVLAGGDPIARDVKSHDGRSYILRISPYRSAAGTVEGAVVTLVDVTPLERAQAVLRDSEEQFRALVDASAQMVWRMDARGNPAGDSPSWRAFTGQNLEQWQESWLDAVHADDRERTARVWREAVASARTVTTEFRLRHAPSGEYRWTTMRAVPLKKPDGTVRGWVGMNTDIQERRAAKEKLLESDRRKDEFLAMLGHELRNPLAAIRSSVELHLAAEGRPELSERAWSIVDRQSGHMARLVNDLLDIVRIDRGKYRLQRETLPLNRCVIDAVEAARPLAEAAGLTLRTDLPDPSPEIEADPERCVQIFGNLLRNAIAYTDAGGTIDVAARREAGWAVVSVSDTGIGLSADETETLFEPYRQAGDGRSHTGLGLGLALVKRLLELHGGTVTAHSEGRGKGSQFRATLPLAEGVVPAARDPVAERPAPRRILVVDDEADVADMFAAVLESLGQQVQVVYSGEAALELAVRQRPDVAFLDLSMPVIGGDELARRLRRALPSDGLCLVALSGYPVDARARDSGFDHHLLKPASVESVVALLNSLDGGRPPQGRA